MQVGPEVGNRMLIGLLGTAMSVIKQELDGGHPTSLPGALDSPWEALWLVTEDPAGRVTRRLLGRDRVWSVIAAWADRGGPWHSCALCVWRSGVS